MAAEMSSEKYRRTRQDAAATASRVVSLLEQEQQDREAIYWRSRFVAIVRVLADPDADDVEVVEEAARLVRQLYSGGRNIGDFYISRKELDERRKVNLAFTDELKTLRRILVEGTDDGLS
ncbi:hypothetical protein [Nocardia sp. IFM 10818]